MIHIYTSTCICGVLDYPYQNQYLYSNCVELCWMIIGYTSTCVCTFEPWPVLPSAFQEEQLALCDYEGAVTQTVSGGSRKRVAQISKYICFYVYWRLRHYSSPWTRTLRWESSSSQQAGALQSTWRILLMRWTRKEFWLTVKGPVCYG